MDSLNSTSLSDAFPFPATAPPSVIRSGFTLLLLLFSSPILSQVLINEVITDPQQDWSSGAFSDAAPGGSAGTDDEWIELYIGADGLDLTGWQITVDDGSPFSGDLTNTGAFDVVNYIGSGSFTNTMTGDYLILGNPDGSGAMNNSGLTITLEDNTMPTRVVIDQIVIDGASGTMFTGNASSVDDESVCRIPNGQDTGVEADDFVLSRATLGTSNSPSGTVVINEVVTDPQQDWDGGGFTSTPGGGGATDGTDEWVELYIGSSGLNLTKWTITIDDGGVFSGDLTSSGAFQVVNYVGSGSFLNTQAGDYLVLGNPTGSQAMNNDVHIELFHPDGSLVDEVEIGDDPAGDGAGDGAPDGSASGGNASGVSDEAIARIANGTDTDNDVNDFQQMQATIGTENGLMNVFVDASAPDDTGLGTVGDPKQLIQSGIDLVLSTGTVTVAAGDYTETLSVSKALTLNGANQGTAGNGARGTETRVDPGSQATALTIAADDVTIDGIQIGTDASTSNATGGITATVTAGITVTNNIIYANSSGISVSGAATGTVDITNNLVSMLAVEDATNATNGSVGIFLSTISGDADANITSNDISNAASGISTYALTSSTEAVIDGGTFTGCTLGVIPLNTDGGGGFSPSTLTIQNLTMSGFVTDADVVNPDTEAGVYVVSAGGTGADDLTITMDNLDISGVGNGASNYSGIIIGDFPTATNGAEITATITNCNIHDNSNRGIYTRGEDAVTNITQTSITGNGFDPTATGGNPGFSVIAREGSSTTVSNCFITNPATLSAPEDIPGNYYVSGLHISTSGSLTISDCNINDNGNGFAAETSGIDLSGNYFNSTVEATIDAAVNSNDFTPWLSSGTDTDLVTNGFQGDFSSLIVGVSGAQTGSTGRIAEAVGLVDASGTIQVNAGTYAENLTIAKSLTLNGANQGVAGSGTRSAESIIEPSSANVGITVGATDITIDGFQFGTDNTTSNITTAISNTSFTGFTGDNNRIFANASGVLVTGISSGTVSLSNNYVEMLGLANPLVTTSPSIGLGMINISGTADIDFIGNDINTATYGIATFGLTSATVPEINGGTYSGCTIGISSSNFDGSVSFSASSLNISNVTMSGFAGPDGGITGASGIPQAGVYAFTTASAPSTDHDLVINVDNADISGVGNGATDYSGIHAADFFNTDPDLEVTDDKGITMTVSNSNIYDNTNRGIHSRGADAVVTINASTITNNANAGAVVFARGTININNSFIVLPSSGATSGLFAQADGQITASNSSFDLNGNADPSTLIANIQDPAGDETIDVSGSWLTSSNETTILSLIDESDTDFTPYLESGIDSDLGTGGFQGDFDALTVTSSGTQTSGDRVQEGHDLVNTDGTITVLLADYAEALTVTKNIAISPASGTTIDDVTLNGGNLGILGNTITIDNSLTMTTGIFDIDQDDGDKSDDPIFVLPTTVNGSSYSADTHFEGKIESSITGLSSFTFEVGDEGAYRPVTLTPTTTTTFQVGHLAEATPTGGGATNPDITNLIGDASANPSGTIQSVLNFRHWDIDVSAGGPPGNTNVALQISSGDNATDPSSLGMTRFDGSDWEILTLVSATGSDPYVITAQTSSFSEFSIYSTDVSANPLPVELVDFYGVKQGRDIILRWSTLSESNSDHFQVEHSKDGVAFQTIGSVASGGNSNERRDYNYVDDNVSFGVHFYRLKMVDFDGSYEYSSIERVTPDLSDVKVMVYPNPATNFIQIEGIDASYLRQLNFYDLNGKIYKSVSSIDSPLITVSDLPEGQYLMRLEMVDGSLYEGKIVKK